MMMMMMVMFVSFVCCCCFVCLYYIYIIVNCQPLSLVIPEFYQSILLSIYCNYYTVSYWDWASVSVISHSYPPPPISPLCYIHPFLCIVLRLCSLPIAFFLLILPLSLILPRLSYLPKGVVLSSFAHLTYIALLSGVVHTQSGPNNPNVSPNPPSSPLFVLLQCVFLCL